MPGWSSSSAPPDPAVPPEPGLDTDDAPAGSRPAGPVSRLRRWAGKDVAWLGAVLLAGAVFWAIGGFDARDRVRIPPPALDIAVVAGTAGGLHTAVFAGGCFWGVQAVFQHTRGVIEAVAGYAGGSADNARYERVATGTTGHAEAVSLRFDPAVISYGQLLQILFSVVHDPTQLNRQGPDFGPQYRSVIFAVDDAQHRVAAAYLSQLGAAGIWEVPIVTELKPLAAFHPAEPHHQDYALRFPDNAYIVAYDKPKIAAMKALFPERFRAEPVRVFPRPVAAS